VPGVRGRYGHVGRGASACSTRRTWTRQRWEEKKPERVVVSRCCRQGPSCEDPSSLSGQICWCLAHAVFTLAWGCGGKNPERVVVSRCCRQGPSCEDPSSLSGQICWCLAHAVFTLAWGCGGIQQHCCDPSAVLPWSGRSGSQILRSLGPGYSS
jgi:hypothetical protein